MKVKLLFFHSKNEWISSLFRNWVSSTDIIWYQSYVKSKEMIQMNLFIKETQVHRLRKYSYG